MVMIVTLGLLFFKLLLFTILSLEFSLLRVRFVLMVACCDVFACVGGLWWLWWVCLGGFARVWFSGFSRFRGGLWTDRG